VPRQTICSVMRLGVLDYRQAWDLQVKTVQGIKSGKQVNNLLLLEHPSVITVGKLSSPDHVLLNASELDELGIQVCETDRGGQVTFHGLGQLVAYPVLNLREWGGPLRYIRTLEEIAIRVLADFGISGTTVDQLTGVWVGDAKIVAIGVKVSQGIAYHGFSINVNTDLDYFEYIVPCGVEERGVTSMAQLLDAEVDLEAVQYSLVYHFGVCMGLRMVETDAIA
jgi:lipoate-protein ligase B